MREELKPCPFCGCGTGNLYVVTIEQHGYDTVGIFCNGCKQTVILEENEWEGRNEQSCKKAIEAWNRRPNDDLIVSPLLKEGRKCERS
jgi:hypothetical protein